MINVSRHAVERYIQRVMGVDASREEIDDIVHEMGGTIAKTILQMIKERDLGVKEYISKKDASYYAVYRNIVIVISDTNDLETSVVTIFKIADLDIKSYDEYIQYIRYMVQTINKLQDRRWDIHYQENYDKFNAIQERINQYCDLLLNNPISIYNCKQKRRKTC